jgi:TPR repeat protein
MNDAPATVGRASSRARPALLRLLGMVCSLALIGSAAFGGPGPQIQQASPEPKPTPEQQFKTVQLKAEQGDAEAEFTLGGMYTNGYGVWQDYEQAAIWFQKAAVHGDAKAQIALGSAYARGQGVPQDDVQAVAWYRKAAEQGDAEAQVRLGVMFGDGVGAPQDYIEALMWTNLAAVRAPGDAQKVFADRLSRKMTPVQIAEAERRAQEWTMAYERRKR